MWFKRKPKNRRLGREHVLDVKLRSSQVRAARLRLATVTLGVVFATVLGVYLVWHGGTWALNRLVYENPAFAIQQIDVQTDGVLAVDKLRRWAGVRPGQNLLALDLSRITRDLEFVSSVRKASVERILPHTLRIRINEREPIAQVNVLRPRPAGGVEMNSLQLDIEGFVMLPLEPSQRNVPAPQPPEQLPLIVTPNPGDLQAGRRLELPQVQAALQLLEAFERSPMAGILDIKRIDVSAPEVLVVTTEQGSEITFGLCDFDEQMVRWQTVFDYAQKTGKVIATLDLAVSNSIPARWLEASAVAPLTPKPARTSRKKHV
jgi:cell division septal protein FtsQ